MSSRFRFGKAGSPSHSGFRARSHLYGLACVLSLGCGHIGIELDADAGLGPGRDSDVVDDESVSQDDDKTEKPYDDKVDDEALADESAEDEALSDPARHDAGAESEDASVVETDDDDGAEPGLDAGPTDDTDDDSSKETDETSELDSSTGPAHDAAASKDASVIDASVDSGSGVRVDAATWDSGQFERTSCRPNCECVAGETCLQECGSDPCSTSCGEQSSCQLEVEAAEHVALECGALATCEALGGLAANVQFTCSGEGECYAKCGQAESCSMECLGPGTCTLFCGQALDCTLDCAEEGNCFLVQEEPLSELELECATDTLLECSDSLLACNAECP